MLTEFIITSFGTFIGWQILRSIIWFNMPARLTNFIVPAIAYGISWLDKPSIFVALAATGGCAVLFRFIAFDSIEPWSLPSFSRKKKLDPGRKRRGDYMLQNRIPTL